MRARTAQIGAYVEFIVVTLLGKTLGIGWVVRYLRNPNPRLTVKLLRAFGAQVGDRTTIKRGLKLDNVFEDAHSAGDFRHLRIGDNCYIGEDVYIDLANEVDIGDNVVLSGQVALITHADCNRSARVAIAFPRQCRPIRIRSGAWLAFRATVLAGVTVGADAVVAAHAMVREDAEPATVYAGTPARPLRTLVPAAVGVGPYLRLPRRRR
jgi:putative colanic acid biosynthesis acetyltransferase WcaF